MHHGGVSPAAAGSDAAAPSWASPDPHSLCLHITRPLNNIWKSSCQFEAPVVLFIIKLCCLLRLHLNHHEHPHSFPALLFSPNLSVHCCWYIFQRSTFEIFKFQLSCVPSLELYPSSTQLLRSSPAKK